MQGTRPALRPSSASALSSLPDPPSTSALPPSTRVPTDILNNRIVDTHGPFITGIALRAAFKPEGFLTLFFSIPYLGSRTEPSTAESLSLDQYKFLGTDMQGVSSDSGEILVHQAWFCILDNCLFPHPVITPGAKSQF